jgi:hypothetical protein
MFGEGWPNQEQEGGTCLGQGGIAGNPANVLIRPRGDVVVHPAVLVHAPQVLVRAGGYVAVDFAVVEIDATDVLVHPKALSVDPSSVQIHMADLIVRPRVGAMDTAIRSDAPQQLVG